MEFTAEQIASIIHGKIIGNPKATVSNIAKIEEAGAQDLSFVANPKYAHYIATSKAAILIVHDSIKDLEAVNSTLILVADPYSAFTKLLEIYQASLKPTVKHFISPKAVIDPDAKVGSNVFIGALSYIDKGAIIEDEVQIYPQVFIGNNVRIGKGTIIHPGVKIYKDCVVGANCIIHAGTVIGADGFGFAPQEDGTFKKVPQLGNVEIGDDVEIGANTCIDRATLGSTKINNNVKLDNLIQLAHNVEIGASTAIAAQAGIAGSTHLGAHCIIGGQAGIVGHISLANRTRINAQSGVSKSVKKEGIDLTGTPAFSYRDALKSQVIFKNLPDLMIKISQLEKEVKQLKELTNKQ